MLTLEEARKYLPDEYKDKPDEEVRKIMDDIQGLTELAEFCEKNGKLREAIRIYNDALVVLYERASAEANIKVTTTTSDICKKTKGLSRNRFNEAMDDHYDSIHNAIRDYHLKDGTIFKVFQKMGDIYSRMARPLKAERLYKNVKTLNCFWMSQPNKLIEELKQGFKLDIDGDHGIAHWWRVEKIGIYLSRGTEADKSVIAEFAFIHDSCRENDYDDPGHGERAAAYAVELHGKGLTPIDDHELEQLVTACKNHSDQDYKTDDITIQICLDADRLDLYRLGEIPDDKFLFTEVAKKRETRDFVLKLLGK